MAKKRAQKGKPSRDVNEAAYDVMRRLIERTEKSPVKKPAKVKPSKRA